MSNLANRVASLEKLSPTDMKKVWLISFIDPRIPGAEIHKLRQDLAATDDGKVWLRHEGETEREFLDRAEREVKFNEWGMATLVQFD